MKITKEKLKKLKKFKTASFALWNNNDISDTLYIVNNLSELHAKIVILGLNPSAGITFLQNFHVGRFDNWYQEAFSIKPFKGAYMTDLISKAEPNSRIVLEKWEKNKNFREKNMRNLEKQFKELGVKNPIILCLGYNTYDLFTKTNIKSGCVYCLKHPNSYRRQGAQKMFINDSKRLGEKIK